MSYSAGILENTQIQAQVALHSSSCPTDFTYMYQHQQNCTTSPRENVVYFVCAHW